MLEDIKVLLDIKDSSKDNLFHIYIRRAITTIQNYLNNDKFTKAYIEENFQDAIIEIVVNAYKMKDTDNKKSKTQGDRSETYFDNTSFCITESVANLLPPPYIRMW